MNNPTINYPIDDNDDIPIGYLKVYPVDNEIKLLCYHNEDETQIADSEIFTIKNGYLDNENREEINGFVANAYNINRKLAALQLQPCYSQILNSSWYTPITTLEDCYTINDKNGSVQIDFVKTAEYLTHVHDIISYADQLYIYEDGIFKPDIDFIKHEIHKVIKGIGYKRSPRVATEDIIFNLKYADPERRYPFNNYGQLIPVDNGVLAIDYETEEIILKPHSPNYKFTFKLPVVYDPEAPTDQIENIINSYVDHPDVLYQIPSQALLQMMGCNPYKKSYILHGEAHAGKSSYLELLTRFTGKCNLSGVSLHQISDDRFAPANMEGRLLNVYDDLSDIPLKDSGTFKKFTGSYLHTVERKQVQPYDALIYAVHVFTCNKPPTVAKDIRNDSAFWERWEYTNFTNIFPVDPEFYDRTFTQENLSGFLNLILKKLIKIKKYGLLVDNDASGVRENWESNSDPLYKFISTNMTQTTTNNDYPKEVFHNKYLEYCRDNKVDQNKIIPNVETFSKRLFPHGFTSKRPRDEDNNRIQAFSSFYRFKPDSTYKIDISKQSSFN